MYMLAAILPLHIHSHRVVSMIASENVYVGMFFGLTYTFDAMLYLQLF